MKNFLKEFKEFAMKGNLLDLAVAVIMAGAFGALVNSFIKDIMMQIVASVLQEPNFENITLGALKIGSFINAFINFISVSFAVFMVVKAANKMKKEEPVVEQTPVINEELETLKAILAELKNK